MGGKVKVRVSVSMVVTMRAGRPTECEDEHGKLRRRIELRERMIRTNLRDLTKICWTLHWEGVSRTTRIIGCIETVRV